MALRDLFSLKPALFILDYINLLTNKVLTYHILKIEWIKIMLPQQRNTYDIQVLKIYKINVGFKKLM